MGRIAYVNGLYVPHREAAVHIEDRGYQLGDGVYEVLAIYRSKLIDEQWHIDRLDRSLREIEMDWPVTPRVLSILMREVVRRNRINDGIIYLQVTRGVAPREHTFPENVQPALVMTTTAKDIGGLVGGAPTKVITVPDQRWARPDIKTICLLPNCIARQRAKEAGCYEAWQVDRNGHITEGGMSNAWIVSAEGELLTRDTSENAILNGITRLAVLELAREAGMPMVERPFSVEEAKAAREAFVTSTTSFVKPVVQIDDTVIAGGEPGPLSKKLGTLIKARLEAAVSEAA